MLALVVLLLIFNVDMFCCLVWFVLLAFQTEGKLYLVLEFLRGGDLFTRLSKEVSDGREVSGLIWDGSL